MTTTLPGLSPADAAWVWTVVSWLILIAALAIIIGAALGLSWLLVKGGGRDADPLPPLPLDADPSRADDAGGPDLELLAARLRLDHVVRFHPTGTGVSTVQTQKSRVSAHRNGDARKG